MKKSDLFFNVLRLPVDFLMLLAAGLVAYFFRTEILSVFRPVLFELNLPFVKYFYLVILASFLFLGAYALSGLYAMRSKMGLAEEFSKIVIASSAGIMIVIVFIFLRQELFDSRFLVLGGWLFAILFVTIGRLVVHRLRIIAVSHFDFGVNKLIIIGSNDATTKIEAEVKGDQSLGYRIVRKLDRLVIEEVISATTNLGANEIILTHADYPPELMGELIDYCRENHITFKFIPAVSQLFASNFEVDIFGGFPLIEIKRTNLDGWGRVIKRTIDIVASFFALVLLAPIFATVSFVIKWETEGPVFVRLRRVSGNSHFHLFKFRSMVENAEELKPYLAVFNERQDGPLFKMRNDPRVTRVGRLIRRFRIDEFPQLWNVLRGDISLVGPRPHQPDEISGYKKHHKKVLAIKAGATGIAQVSGSSDLNFEEEVALDSFYIDNWSLWLDLKILLKTALKIFFDRSAV